MCFTGKRKQIDDTGSHDLKFGPKEIMWKFDKLRVIPKDEALFVLNGTILALQQNLMKRFAAQQPGQGMDVEKTVAVLDPYKNQYGELRSVLEEEHYRVQSFQSMEDLPRLLGEWPVRALILDLDLLSVSNRSLKELRKHNPDLCIIVLSGRSFHPELKEALSHYIDACFSKPVEWEDLLYYLRGALNNAVKKGPQPDLLE